MRLGTGALVVAMALGLADSAIEIAGALGLDVWSSPAPRRQADASWLSIWARWMRPEKST